MTLEIRTDMYTLPCVKQRASGPLPDSTERSVQWNGNGGGGRHGRGSTQVQEGGDDTTS